MPLSLGSLLRIIQAYQHQLNICYFQSTISLITHFYRAAIYAVHPSSSHHCKCNDLCPPILRFYIQTLCNFQNVCIQSVFMLQSPLFTIALYFRHQVFAVYCRVLKDLYYGGTRAAILIQGNNTFVMLSVQKIDLRLAGCRKVEIDSSVILHAMEYMILHRVGNGTISGYGNPLQIRNKAELSGLFHKHVFLI